MPEPVVNRRSDAATPHAARVHSFVSELSQFVHDAGGIRTSARDHARVLLAVGVNAEARLAPIWALLLMTPAAVIGFLPLIWASLGFGWGLAGLWSGLSLFMVIRLVAVLTRLRSGRWAVTGASRS